MCKVLWGYLEKFSVEGLSKIHKEALHYIKLMLH